MEMFQYQAALVITGAIEGTSYNLLFQEFCLESQADGRWGLESQADRRWSRKIFFFYKIVNGLLPSYL